MVPSNSGEGSGGWLSSEVTGATGGAGGGGGATGQVPTAVEPTGGCVSCTPDQYGPSSITDRWGIKNLMSTFLSRNHSIVYTNLFMDIAKQVLHFINTNYSRPFIAGGIHLFFLNEV